MWGRLKRRILRSKGRGGGGGGSSGSGGSGSGGSGGGGIYNSSQDDGFSEVRDTYRDFREELYDESRETMNRKDGRPNNKRPSLTAAKTPFSNLDRCSCGTPGGRDLMETVVKSETLRRKNDFIFEVDERSPWIKATDCVNGKAKNEYTSTSTGPGTRQRIQEDEMRMKVSTSAGQIPPSISMHAEEDEIEEEEEQVMNDKNNQLIIRRQKRPSCGEIQRRTNHSEDQDDDDDDEEMEDTDEDSDDREDLPVPSTSQAFRNSSQSEGTKSSSNSSDYTSLAFDLNYVKVSPPKLRRRRRKNCQKDEEESAPLMIRRERRFPEPIPDRLPRSRGGQFEGKGKLQEEKKSNRRLVTNSDDVVQATNQSSVAMSIESVGQKKINDSSEQVPVQLKQQQQQHQSDYVSLGDLHQQLTGGGPPPLPHPSGGVALEQETAVKDCEDKEEKALECRELPISGSVLQFTFTVRLDNEVIRGTRRDSDKGNNVIGPSLVSGRVDILNQENHGQSCTTNEALNRWGNHDQHQQQQQPIPGSVSGSVPPHPPSGLTQRSFKVQLKDREMENATTMDCLTDDEHLQKGGKDEIRLVRSQMDYPASSNQHQSGIGNVSNNAKLHKKIHELRSRFEERLNDERGGICHGQSEDALDGMETPDHCFAIASKSVDRLDGGGGRQVSLDDMLTNHRTILTTTALVHRSASDLDREETQKDQVFTEGHSRHDTEPVAAAGGDGTGDVGLVRRTCKCASSPVLDQSSAEVNSELTHMSWDEVMKEAQRLGIPLTRVGCCSRPDKSHHPHHIQTMQTTPDALPRQDLSPQEQSYWVCPSCTEAMHSQASSPAKQIQTPSKTSSPFKEKFKLQGIFGGKKPREEKQPCRGQGQGQGPMTSPIACKLHGPGPKYKTMPVVTIKDALENGHHCTCASSRNVQQTTTRPRSMSPASTSRCMVNGPPSSSHRLTSHYREDARGRHISHLCSPPLLRCKFGTKGRTTAKTNNSPPNAKDTSHLSSEKLACSSSPKIHNTTGGNKIDRDFLKCLAQLMDCMWYWGSLSFEAAEAVLFDRSDGSFLIRDSSDNRYILSVSFRSQGSTHHVRIERQNGMFSFSAEHGLHEASDIVEFVNKAVELSRSGQCLYYLRPRHPSPIPVPVLLLYPVSRFAR